MKKILVLIPFVSLFMFATPVSAQMMGNFASPTPATQTQSQTAQDEAAGKAVWDKLQGQQVTCANLKDDDFDVLGDFFMGNMMGANHDSMNQMMVQRLGADGEKQMHISLGKRLSGCDVNATLPQGGSYFAPMMGLSSGMMSGLSNNSQNSGIGKVMGYGYGNMMGNSFGIFGLVTWIALLVFLVSGSMFFLKKLNTLSKK